jgi:hypothetical protein
MSPEPKAFVIGSRRAEYHGPRGGVTARCHECGEDVVLLSQESVRLVATCGHAILCAECAVAKFSPLIDPEDL